MRKAIGVMIMTIFGAPLAIMLFCAIFLAFDDGIVPTNSILAGPPVDTVQALGNHYDDTRDSPVIRHLHGPWTSTDWAARRK